VLTDSGGIQEETTVLGIPCLTLRENTERPITVELGTNRLVGTRAVQILTAVNEILDGTERRTATIPELWDGKTADRILNHLAQRSSGGK
jgi:UDP-N-acetylglucosamine 2-epimerase (non-hydrolysing)